MTAWLFQGNPNPKVKTGFDINAYLRRNRASMRIRWRVSPVYLVQDIVHGQQAFIWRCVGDGKQEGGVVAVGTIASEPTEMGSDAPDLWFNGPPSNEALLVEIKLDEIRLNPTEGMLRREALRRDCRLSDLPNLKFYQKTTFEIGPDHEKWLLDEWRRQARSNS